MLEILYEDNHIIAINKRSGDIIQGDKTGDKPLSDFVKEYVKERYKKPGNVFLGTIHRLDRPTSGIVLFARTTKALKRMNEQFRNKAVKKTYFAIVKNRPISEAGTLDNYLKKNEKQNKSYITENKEGKHAILNYKLLKKLKNYYLLELTPETGRHHQIRAQLAHINCIIKGDLKYGAKRNNKNKGIHLHSKKIGFKHPVKKETLIISAPLPKDHLWDSCRE